MLQNAYLLIFYLQESVPIQPKTSEILPKFCQKLATTLRGAAGRAPRPRPAPPGSPLPRPYLGPKMLRFLDRENAFLKIFKFCNFLAGSFSAVSKRNFARKYAFDSIFQALQDLHTSFSWPFHRRPFSLKYQVVHFLFLRFSAYVSIRS